ncbi:flippase [Candidatus Parcubacteria bacterium]|nr:flippase [Candidatus Parcubacteria bacterium]
MKILNIAKNTSYFTLALIIQKIISFSYFTIIARNLLPDDLGKYYFAISLTTIFAIFIDLGLSNVLMREVPKIKEKIKEVEKILGSVIAIKLPLALISIVSVIFLVNVLGYPQITKYLVYLSCLAMVLDSFSTTFFSTIRGFHNLKFESIASILLQAIILSIGLIVLKMNLGLLFLMGAMITGSVFNFIFSLSLIKFKWKINIKLNYNSRFIKSLAVLTVPFALFAVLQRFYMYFDTVLLSKLASDYYVGLYQIPFKIIFALQFLPLAFMASLYPAFSSYWKSNKEQLSISFVRALNYLIVISLPISAGVIVLADKILLIFKPEYMAAVVPLQIIIASLFFIFVNFPIGALLNACDKQKTNTRNMAITLFASVCLNIILITKYQAVGASITVLTTNFLMFVLGASVVPSITKFNIKKVALIFIKSCASAVAMGFLIVYFKNQFSILILIPFGAFVYLLLVFISGAIKKEDIKSILKTVR